MPISPRQTAKKTVYLFRGLWSPCSQLSAEGVVRKTERTGWCHHGFGPPVLLKLTVEKLPSNLVVGTISVPADYWASWMSHLTRSRTCIKYPFKNKTLESGKLRPRLQFDNAALFLLPWSPRFFLIHERAAKRRTRIAFSRLPHAKKNKWKPVAESGYFYA